MPELPEVETTRRGLAPHLIGRRVVDLIIRQPQLRWPVAAGLQQLRGQRIESVERRAKYLLVGVAPGSALLHLGMSGSLRVLPRTTTIGKHDHVDWLLDSDQVLRYTDPRRFGSQLWQADGETHPLLINLGPEPLSDDFDGDYLYRHSRGRHAAISMLQKPCSPPAFGPRAPLGWCPGHVTHDWRMKLSASWSMQSLVAEPRCVTS